MHIAYDQPDIYDPGSWMYTVSLGSATSAPPGEKKLGSPGVMQFQIVGPHSKTVQAFITHNVPRSSRAIDGELKPPVVRVFLVCPARIGGQEENFLLFRRRLPRPYDKNRRKTVPSCNLGFGLASRATMRFVGDYFKLFPTCKTQGKEVPTMEFQEEFQ